MSRAALHGGTTTLIDFVVPRDDEALQPATDRFIDEWSGKCHCDFSFHVLLRDRLSAQALDDVAALIDRGLPSFKIFTTNVRPSVVGRMISYGSLWELMQVTARHNGIIAVHAEDDDLVMHMYDKLISEGRVGYENMSVVHSAMSEDLSFKRVIRLAQHVPGAALYMMHVSAGFGVETIQAARAQGVPVYGETLHQYALHTHDDYLGPDGMKYHTYPSLKSQEDVDALWRGVESGDIATFATDELCTTYAEKTAGKRIDNVTGGNTGAEPRMAIVYTEVVTKRNLGLAKFVDLTSANAARLMGMYPKKGSYRSWKRRRPRRVRSECGADHHGVRASRVGLHAMGRMGGERVARHDDAAREVCRRRRGVPLRARRRPPRSHALAPEVCAGTAVR